jgi:hypothetical protein
MSDIGASLPSGLAPAAGVEPTTTSRPVEPSIGFRAMLERLREQAESLEKATERRLGAGELSGAVQEAHGSLQGALSIAEGLLEAYRSSRMPAAEIPAGEAPEA